MNRTRPDNIAGWALIGIGIAILVAIAFPTTPEVKAAISPPVEVAAEPTKLYDVPLSAEVQEYISETCEAYGVDMPLVLAIIGQESNYDLTAIGDNGNSIGLMQIQPRHHQGRMDRLGVTDLFDPYQNVLVGIDLLAELMGEKYDAEWAVTAYNAGKSKADFNKAIGVRSGYTEGVLRLREMIENEN